MAERPVPEAVAALWERFRPLVRSRIETLERFAEGDARLGAEDAPQGPTRGAQRQQGPGASGFPRRRRYDRREAHH